MQLDDARPALQLAVGIETAHPAIGQGDVKELAYTVVVVVMAAKHTHHVALVDDRGQHAAVHFGASHPLKLVAAGGIVVAQQLKLG